MKDSDAREAGGEHEETSLHARVEWGRVLISGAIGTALAACLTIVGAQLEGHLVRGAMYALVAGMPLVSVHLFVTAPGHEKRHQVSCLMRAIPMVGLIAIVIALVRTCRRRCRMDTVVLRLAIALHLCSSRRTRQAAEKEPRSSFLIRLDIWSKISNNPSG